MDKASQDLMHEHEAILLALNVIESITAKIAKGKPAELSDIGNMLEFLKVFADKCHHGKEEDMFFPALVSVGVRKENGPVGVMMSQHTMGRGLISQMNEALSSNPFNSNMFTDASTGYIELMRGHIQKENLVLFPMGDALLSEETQKKLLADFENYEKTVIGEGKHEEFHALLKAMKKKYL